MNKENLVENLKRIGKVGGGIFLGVGVGLTPHPVDADPASITLTPPEGSVTPGAFGSLNVELLSRRPDNLVELVIDGQLNGLIPERLYRVWACWDTEFDCGTNANPEIRTGLDGSVSFNRLQFTVFDRPQHPITSLQVREEPPGGGLAKDACAPGFTPCLRAAYTVQGVVR